MTTHGPSWDAAASGGDDRGPAEGLDIEVSRPAPGVVLVSLSGELEMYTTYPLMDALVQATSEGPELIVLELAGVEFMSAAGVSVLLHGAPQLDDVGIALAVVCPSGGRVARVLELADTGGALHVYPTVDEALSCFLEPLEEG
jgi:anti-sigma B factor antagonist